MIKAHLYSMAALTALALVCKATPAEEPNEATQDRPNILLLFTDDQRADTIAALGNPVVKTPNLDRLCEQGLVFNRAYMQGAFGGATCIPSRAMLLSGQSLFRVDNRLQRDETWPAAFGRAGYRTLMTGKWHNTSPSIPKCFQVARTIRTVGYTKEAPMRVRVCDLKEDGTMTELRWTEKHAAAAYADEAVRFLNETPTDQPFFLYVPFDGPHDPHIVPDDFPITYDPEDIRLPPNFMPSGVLHDPGQPGRSDLVFAYRNVQRAIATPDWKLIRYPEVNRTQLFDLQKDPQEIHDLSSGPEQAARVQELMERLKQRLTEAGDELKHL